MPAAVAGALISGFVTEAASDWAFTSVASFMLEVSETTIATGIGALTSMSGPTRLIMNKEVPHEYC